MDENERIRKKTDENGYAAEDHEFASRINTLCGELTIACQKRIYFVQELETVKSLIAPVTMAEFLNEIQFKDDQRNLVKGGCCWMRMVGRLSIWSGGDGLKAASRSCNLDPQV
ncbi:hypothetical protein Tco_1577514 [Tanacetum coccineum]